MLFTNIFFFYYKISLGQNIHVYTNSTITDGTYITFIVLMFLGFAIACFSCNASDIRREDGSKVVLMKNPTWTSELVGLWQTVKRQPFFILFFPLFFASNWFYAYEFNVFNGSYFDTRTKAFNSLFFWTGEIFGAIAVGLFLDSQHLRKSVRAKVHIVLLTSFTILLWSIGYLFARSYTREDVSSPSFLPTDWTSDGYVTKVFLFFFYGAYDALLQASINWYLPTF